MSLSHVSVLVVDDESPIRISLGSYLEDRGFEVFSVESAEDALSLIAVKNVDVAVVDIRLPKIDGHEFILKAHEIRPSLKCLIHTGSASHSLPESLSRIGVNAQDVFQKPLSDMSVLVDAIHRLVGKQG